MEEINGLLNRLGDYRCIICGEEISLIGVLRRENNNIVFQSRMSIELLRKLDLSNVCLQFWGFVNGKSVTLTSVIFRYYNIADNSGIVDVEFNPNGIIIGKGYRDEPKVRSISGTIIALNNMFSGNPFHPKYNNPKDNLCFYIQPQRIETDDKYGHLQICQATQQKWARDEIVLSSIPMIEYKFNKSVSVTDALGKIMAVRNLFSFFADGYLTLENIKFSEGDSDEVDPTECDIVLYLNYQEDVLPCNSPFLIRSADFERDFPKIWQNWLVMYEDAEPITTLFYEIICNRSTRVNCFLNLSQAIEVYSAQYREIEVLERARKEEKTKPDKKPKIYLKHRFEDIFFSLNDYLEIPEDKLCTLAENLANMRNYYTHYNSGKYRRPSYQEMFSATRIFRFILLVIVYKQLGLNTEVIVNVRKRVRFRSFREDAKKVLGYSSD